MTYGAAGRAATRAGSAPLWKTGIISRVHHWYQRTCAARAAAYALQRGRAATARWPGRGAASRRRRARARCRCRAAGSSRARRRRPGRRRPGRRRGTACARPRRGTTAGSRWSTRSSSGAHRGRRGRPPRRARPAARGPARAAIARAALGPEDRDPAQPGGQDAEVLAGAAQALEQLVARTARRGRRRSSRARRSRRGGRGPRRPCCAAPASGCRRSRPPGRRSRGRRAGVSTASPPATGRTPVTRTPELDRHAASADVGEQQREQRPAVHAERRHRAGHVGVRHVDEAAPGRGADVDPRHLARLRPQRPEQVEPVQDLLAHVLEPDPGADRARVVLLLEHADVVAAVGEQAREGGAGHAEADDRDPHRLGHVGEEAAVELGAVDGAGDPVGAVVAWSRTAPSRAAGW